jgi:hypothetical protein
LKGSDIAQVVEFLPSKHEALSSIPQYHPQKKERKRKRKITVIWVWECCSVTEILGLMPQPHGKKGGREDGKGRREGKERKRIYCYWAEYKLWNLKTNVLLKLGI